MAHRPTDITPNIPLNIPPLLLRTFPVQVETIGDAYMVVSGMPIRNGTQHAREVGVISLRLLDVIKNFVIPHRPNEQFRMRIGLHSGPCVAGVVGLKTPKYCIFGDTIILAMAMESSSERKAMHMRSFSVSM